MRTRGLSLVETMVALFLLAGAALASLALLSQASRNQRLTIETLQATRLAHQGLDRVSQWARLPATFNTGWATYADATFTDPNYPGFSLRIRSNPALTPLLSPNTSLEAPFAPNQRQLDDRTRTVKSTVTWTSNQPHTIDLQTLVGAPVIPVRTTNPIDLTLISGTSSPMAVNGTATYRAELKDTSDATIPGVSYYWSLEPNYTSLDPGMGSVELMDRVGTRATMINHYYAGDPTTPTVPGYVNLHIRCRYAGREYVNAIPAIVLSP